MGPEIIAGIVIVFALAFTFTNGMNDAANAIATVVCTRVLTPAMAVAFGAILNFVGALVAEEVAKTICTGVAPIDKLTPAALMATVIISPIWIGICTWKGLPISCSHSLLGALFGGIIGSVGFEHLSTKKLAEIGWAILASPISGFVLAILIVVAISWIFRRVRPGTVNRLFSVLQVGSAGLMAYSHGTGDAQKAIGIITAALIVTGHQKGGDFHVQLWVKLLCAVVMGLGTAIGGWTVVKTLGSRLAHIKTYQGFAAETAASATILLTTSVGIPISTTHSITGAIMGVGAVRGMRRVRWGIGGKIVFAWVFTFPFCITGGILCVKMLRFFGLN